MSTAGSDNIVGTVKLNLGCGERWKDGFINVDAFNPADMIVDLNSFPWPWEDNTVDEIYSRGCFEHLQDFNAALREAHRVLKPGGRLQIIVPHFRNPQAAWPQQHIHQFSIYTFTHHLSQSNEYSGNPPFSTVSVRHIYLDSRLSIFNRLANISPLGWEWVGLPTMDCEWVAEKAVAL